MEGIPLVVLEAREKKVFGRPINLRELGSFDERITSEIEIYFQGAMGKEGQGAIWLHGTRETTRSLVGSEDKPCSQCGQVGEGDSAPNSRINHFHR